MGVGGGGEREVGAAGSQPPRREECGFTLQQSAVRGSRVEMIFRRASCRVVSAMTWCKQAELQNALSPIHRQTYLRLKSAPASKDYRYLLIVIALSEVFLRNGFNKAAKIKVATVQSVPERHWNWLLTVQAIRAL